MRRDVIITIIFITLITFLSRCAGSSPDPSTATSEPTMGTIKGKIMRADGKPLVDMFRGETGYLILICPENNNSKGECLHEEDMQKDVSEIVASICEIGETSNNCELHLMIGANELGISGDGSYIFPAVFPGEYDLLLIIISNGIPMTIELINVDPVQAGKTVEYNFTSSSSAITTIEQNRYVSIAELYGNAPANFAEQKDWEQWQNEYDGKYVKGKGKFDSVSINPQVGKLFFIATVFGEEGILENDPTQVALLIEDAHGINFGEEEGSFLIDDVYWIYLGENYAFEGRVSGFSLFDTELVGSGYSDLIIVKVKVMDIRKE